MANRLKYLQRRFHFISVFTCNGEMPPMCSVAKIEQLRCFFGDKIGQSDIIGIVVRIDVNITSLFRGGTEWGSI